MNHTLMRCPACGAGNRIPFAKLHLRPKCGRCGESMATSARVSALELSDASLESAVRESTLPVLVDFYSPTCGPCRSLAPVIESIAQNFAGRVLVAKLDTSRFQSSAAAYRIRGVPTLILFKQGRIVDQIVGAAPQAQIEQTLKKHL